jgi:hypothetical protein
MNYHPLKTRPFLTKVSPQNITADMIEAALQHCFQHSAFSTFPYIMYNMNSKQAMRELRCGNCVALSMYLQEVLQQQYGVRSYLIPATIPNVYKLPSLLDICHVALAIPRTKSTLFIADVAFYFLRPLEIRLHRKTIPEVYSKEVYKYEPAQDLADYTTLKRVQSKVLTQLDRHQYNDYQSMPRNTTVCQCNYANDVDDTWSYFLREVCNPDRAISTFFINCKKTPFICSTKHDPNNVCTSDMCLKFVDNQNIQITYNANPSEVETFHLNHLRGKNENRINKHIRHFMKDDVSAHIGHIPFEQREYIVED